MGKRGTSEISARSLQGQLAEKYSHLITHAIYIYLRRRNETTGRKRQWTTVSTRKPRRNDTRASANWALEVTPSRGMLFHPRSVPRQPPTLYWLPASPPPFSQSLSHHLASSSYIANWCGRRGRFRRSLRKTDTNIIKNRISQINKKLPTQLGMSLLSNAYINIFRIRIIISYTFSQIVFKHSNKNSNKILIFLFPN